MSTPPLFAFKPISYTPITADHPWVMKVSRTEHEGTDKALTGQQTARKDKAMKIEVLRDQNGLNRSCRKYSHIKSRITPEETTQYLERKKVRERQRIEDAMKRETAEMQECTFHPVCTRTYRRPY